MGVFEDKVRSIEDQLRQDWDVAEPLDRVAVIDGIRQTAESATRTAVEEARASGETWASIARWLQVSPQAAHQRYGPPRTGDPALDGVS